MNCIICGNEIPEGRLKVLPATKTCAQCSNVDRVAGFAMIESKTEYSALQIVDKKTYRNLTRLDRTKGRI